MTARDFFEELMQQPLGVIQQSFKDQYPDINVVGDVKFSTKGKAVLIQTPETYPKPVIREIGRQIRQRAKFVNFEIEAM